jgi:hypothetical protein
MPKFFLNFESAFGLSADGYHEEERGAFMRILVFVARFGGTPVLGGSTRIVGEAGVDAAAGKQRKPLKRQRREKTTYQENARECPSRGLNLGSRYSGDLMKPMCCQFSSKRYRRCIGVGVSISKLMSIAKT